MPHPLSGFHCTTQLMGGVACEQPSGLACFLSSIRERMNIPTEFGLPYVSLPAKYTNNHNPTKCTNPQTNAQTHPADFAALGEQQPLMLTLPFKTHLKPSMSPLTNGHNFFNASKLFVNEQGGAVVTPKPLWLEREKEKEKSLMSLMRWRKPHKNYKNQTSWFL